jgi:hypothetical protein
MNWIGEHRESSNKFRRNLLKTKFTPPSPTKATPNDITRDKKYLSMTSVSDGDDVMMTSSTQNESNKVHYSTLVKENPPEGKSQQW